MRMSSGCPTPPLSTQPFLSSSLLLGCLPHSYGLPSLYLEHQVLYTKQLQCFEVFSPNALNTDLLLSVKIPFCL